MTKRFTKTIATMIVAAFIFTGCTAKNTAPVTTETIDVTTYTVIDDKEPTITETSKNEDGTTVVITKTTDGTIVSKATTKETEGTTTTQETSKVTTTEPTTSKAEPTVTEPKVTTEPTTKATEPTATPTETTKPTDTPKPTETTKPTDAPKPTEPKPTETTKPTTQPTKPTTSPTTPEPKPTTPEPTETTPKPTTPEPTKKYWVIVNNSVYNFSYINGTKGDCMELDAGTKVTVKVSVADMYKDNYTCYIEVNGANKGTSYTFTLNSDVEITVKAEEVKQPEPQYETYTTTGTVTVTYSTYADGPDVNYTKTFEHVTIVNENSVVGNPSTRARDYQYTTETYNMVKDWLATQGVAGFTVKVTAVD